MKKKIIFGLAMIGASVAVLGGCGGTSKEENVEEVKIGYEGADYTLYSSKYPNDNLINKKIWIEGRVGYISPNYDGEVYTDVVDDDLRSWSVILGKEGVEDELDYDDLMANRVIVSGIYRGIDRIGLYPEIVAEKIYDQESNKIINTIYKGLDVAPTIPTETETTEETTVYETTVNEEGFSDLQLFYLSLKEGDTFEDVKNKAEEKGYFVKSESIIVAQEMWISEKETIGLGDGAETWYRYDTDSIRIFFDSEDKLSSKYYRFQDDLITVSYSYYDNEIEIENKISGEIGSGKINVPTEKFDNLEDALKYVNNNK